MKRYITYPVALLLLSFFVLVSIAQKPVYPNTLLWRISGKDLTKPSYLFGTMHLQDRRIFQFSDSLYYFLEHAEGYAMEINPDDAMTAFLQALNEPDTSDYIYKDIKKEDFKKVAGNLEIQFGIPADKITKKQYWLYKQNWRNAIKARPDDMDAAVDMYLYNIAKRQGKWVGGIEDIEDQFNLLKELGEKPDVESLLSGGKDQAGTLEKFIKVYAAQDLNQLDQWINHWSTEEKDKVLIRRNKKMAYRIDSMAHVRNHFFAVGAAHLLGEEGLITLLTQKGYTVTPVFSKKKIAPERYKYTPVNLPWHKVANDEGSYEVQMPGKSVPFMPYGDAIKMQVYTDMGTGLMYFVTAIDAPVNKSKDSLLAQYAANFSHNNKQNKPVAINYKGTEGREAISNNSGYQYRIRVFLSGDHAVLVMAGAKKKALLYTADAETFFNSLVLKSYTKPAATANKEWYIYSNTEKNFQVSFPTKPVPSRELTETSAKNKTEGWQITNQTAMDLANQIYYMLIVKETQPGYYIISDSVVFDDIKRNMQSNEEVAVTFIKEKSENGIPHLYLNGRYKQQNFLLQSVHINKDNRSFSLLAIYDKSLTDTANISRFLHSLEFSDSKNPGWQTYSGPGHIFSTYAATPFVKKESEDTSVTATAYSLLAHDNVSGFPYHADVAAISPYFWCQNDSTFFAQKISGYIGENDSLLSATPVTNAGADGMEYQIRLGKEGRNIQKARLFVNGDSVYALYAIIPPNVLSQPEVNKFFNDFRFAHYQKNMTLFKSKTQQLLNDLQSADSATNEKAKAYWSSAPFTKADLPLLHQALLQPFADFSSEEYCNHDRVLGTVMDMADSTTVEFIRQHYPQLSGEKEKLKYPILKVLASVQTDSAYALLKHFLTTNLPKDGKPAGLSYMLSDSLALTKTIYPALLPLVTDTVFCDVLVAITNRLADSSLINKELWQPYKKSFLTNAHLRYEQLKTADADNAWRYYEWIYLLGKLNDSESNGLLQQIVQLSDIGIKKLAVIELIKNKQPVDKAHLQTIAADKTYRIGLYEELKELDKLLLFPAAYTNQKSLSESELYNYISEDYEPTKMSYIGERTAAFQGIKKKFQLFKLTYEYEDGSSASYLGVAGPYAVTGKELITQSDVLGISDKELDNKKIEAQLNAFLQQQESYLSGEE